MNNWLTFRRPMYINKYDTKSVDEQRGSLKPHPSMQSKCKCLHVLEENIFDNPKDVSNNKWTLNAFIQAIQ